MSFSEKCFIILTQPVTGIPLGSGYEFVSPTRIEIDGSRPSDAIQIRLKRYLNANGYVNSRLASRVVDTSPAAITLYDFQPNAPNLMVNYSTPATMLPSNIRYPIHITLRK